MLQNVSCHNGKCWEDQKGVIARFDELFQEDNIVDQIEKELWKKEIY